MSVWGKVFGVGAGLALGGPLGALLGGVAGHYAIDKLNETRDEDSEKVKFAIAIIALSAKMAKADGIVTQDEIDAFHDILEVPPEEAQKVELVYNLAKEDVSGYQHYARQIAGIYKDKPAILEDVLDAMFHIALADGHAHPNELTFMGDLASIFGFTDAEYRRIEASHIGPDKDDPYVILGLAHDADDEELKRTYRRLARENHPDALIARGVPEEFIKVAEAKLATINTAYEAIVAEREKAEATA